jgi:hypothetical protein
MNHNEEREMYLNLLNKALDERRELSAMINEFRERLNELNRLEKMGLDEIKTRGYVELFQAKQQLAATNELPKPKVDTVSELRYNDVYKEEEKKNKRGSRGTQDGLFGQKGFSMIEYVLKTADKPLSLQEMREAIHKQYGVEIESKRFNTLLKKARDKNSLIVNAARGVYTYNK